MDYVTVLFWSLIGGVVSLVGGLTILTHARLRTAAVRFGLPFGAGALLAAGFLGLLPEAVEGSDIHTTALYALGGFLAFFVLERSLGWFHHHEHHHHADAHGEKNATHQSLVVIGDTVHNAIDGIAIGAAFLINPAAGIGTAIAVAAHEIPQEIGDFSILLAKGMKPRRVVLINVLSALATVVAALSVYALGDSFSLNPAPLLAVAAGFFIYIAASDIIPDIHEKPRREGTIQALLLLVGVLVIGLVIAATPHSHETAGQQTDHSEEHHDEHSDDVHAD